MGKLRSFTVTFNDGSTISTNMAATITNQEIRDHYIGQPFTNEQYQHLEPDANGQPQGHFVEITRRGVKVDIHPDLLTCPHCGHGQPHTATTTDQCSLKCCGKTLNTPYAN